MNQVANIDHTDPPVIVAMDGQVLPVTAWADRDGVVVARADADVCTAGPDAAGSLWLVDVRRQRRLR